MTAPAVTIAIPFHDEERRLEQAIRSVLRQTFSDFELLLLDDGSSDRSLEIARSFADARIVVVSDGLRRGLPARLNEIVDRARGQLVARMDGDDVIHPTRLAKQVEHLSANARCDVVGTWMGIVDDQDVPFGVLESTSFPPDPYSVLAHGVMGHAAIVARREWCRANRYDEGLTAAEDRDLWARTAQQTRFAVLDELLYVIRVEANEVSFLSKYLEAQAVNRQLLLRHGPALVGLASTARLVAESAAKSVVMRGASAMHLLPRLVRRRGRPPRPHEVTLIREALASGSASVARDDVAHLVE